MSSASGVGGEGEASTHAGRMGWAGAGLGFQKGGWAGQGWVSRRHGHWHGGDFQKCGGGSHRVMLGDENKSNRRVCLIKIDCLTAGSLQTPLACWVLVVAGLGACGVGAPARASSKKSS